VSVRLPFSLPGILEQDFTKKETRFDIIFDAVGKTTKSACKHLLNQKENMYLYPVHPIKTQMIYYF